MADHISVRIVWKAFLQLKKEKKRRISASKQHQVTNRKPTLYKSANTYTAPIPVSKPEKLYNMQHQSSVEIKNNNTQDYKRALNRCMEMVKFLTLGLLVIVVSLGRRRVGCRFVGVGTE